VADEGVYEAFAFSRNFDLDGAAVACRCCGAVFLAVCAFGGEVDLFGHVVRGEVILNRGESLRWSCSQVNARGHARDYILAHISRVNGHHQVLGLSGDTCGDGVCEWYARLG
jgi:hypothetical protein